MDSALQSIIEIPDLQAMWLVGSHLHKGDSQDIDLIAALNDHPNQITLCHWLKNNITTESLITDDVIRFPLKQTTCSIAFYASDELCNLVRDISNGLLIHGSHRSWAVGYWLPEAFLGDLASSHVVYDSSDWNATIKSMISPYPNQLMQSLRTYCHQEILLKLVHLKQPDELVYANLAKADVMAALIRLAFAISRKYLRGFKRLPIQIKSLSNDGQIYWQLSQRLSVEMIPIGQQLIADIELEINDANSRND